MPVYVVRRRARRRKTLNKFIKGKLMGLVFIALAVLLVSIFGWFATIVPDYYIYLSPSTGLGAGTTLPNETGVTSVNIKAIVGIIVAFADILMVISGIRRLGIHM